MAKSKKRKTIKKTNKRQLVLEVLPSGRHSNVNPKMLHRLAAWQGEVTVESETMGDIFAINADRPVSLVDFLGIIRRQVKTLVPENTFDCWVRVYLRSQIA